MAVLETIDFPHRTPCTSVPDLISPRADHALERLLYMEPSVRPGALLHVVDYGALTEIRDAIKIKSRAERRRDLRELHDQVEACREAIERRREWAMGLETQERREAEFRDSQIMLERDRTFPPSDRELQRRMV